MLLNEFLKERRKAAEQGATLDALKASVVKQDDVIIRQEKLIESLSATLKKQAAEIQKVSAQLQTGQHAPRLASSSN